MVRELSWEQKESQTVPTAHSLYRLHSRPRLKIPRMANCSLASSLTKAPSLKPLTLPPDKAEQPPVTVPEAELVSVCARVLEEARH